MTRLQEIINAEEAFYRRILEEGSYYSPRDCFEEGAEWADANPKQTWINVKDKLPPEEKDGLSAKVIVISTNSKIDFSRYDYETGGWISPVLDIEFTHWMSLPELPKE